MSALEDELSFDGAVTAKPAPTVVDEAVDYVPTIDDHPDNPPQASYKHWRDEDTRVVTYAINSTYRGITVATTANARAHCRANYGEILDEQAVPDRLFLRVRRVK